MFNIQNDVPMAKFTTYGIGGSAKYFISACNSEELTEALKWCKKNQLPCFLIGAGSNILVSDDGFSGLIFKLSGDFASVEFDDTARTMTLGAAARLPKVAAECGKRGISGFEGLCDIPGTIGAAVRINAGTKICEIKDLFVSADILDEQCNIRTLNLEDMDFGYRTSMLMHNRWIVLKARIRYGAEKSPKEVLAAMKAHRAARRAKQPLNPRSCGSVFKPPGGRPAGWYIEQCGLKGKRVGDAMIAKEHANWIVNLGAASASDIKELIRLAQNAVKERFGVSIEREVEYVPEDLIGVCSNE